MSFVSFSLIPVLAVGLDGAVRCGAVLLMWELTVQHRRRTGTTLPGADINGGSHMSTVLIDEVHASGFDISSVAPSSVASEETATTEEMVVEERSIL